MMPVNGIDSGNMEQALKFTIKGADREAIKALTFCTLQGERRL
jgi:hypothetical protein